MRTALHALRCMWLLDAFDCEHNLVQFCISLSVCRFYREQSFKNPSCLYIVMLVP